MDVTPWDQVGKTVAAERLKRTWGKEEAARNAGVSSITWKRLEDGLKVQDRKLAAIFNVLGMSGTVAADQSGIAGFAVPDAAVGGETQDDDHGGYVAAPGERVEPGVSNAQVLRAIQQMRDAHARLLASHDQLLAGQRTLSERVENLERRGDS